MSVQSVAATATLVAIASSGIGFLWQHQSRVCVVLHESVGLECTGFCTRTAAVRNEIIGIIKTHPNSCNSISDENLRDIKVLDLSADSIKGLQSGDFVGLTKLEKLILRGNHLVELPQGVFDNLKKLTTLDLGENGLTALPAGVFDSLKNLKSLDLGENELELQGLPGGVFNELKNLKKLRLGGNHLEGLTPQHTLFEHLNSKVIIDLGLDDSGSTKTG